MSRGRVGSLLRGIIRASQQAAIATEANVQFATRRSISNGAGFLAGD